MRKVKISSTDRAIYGVAGGTAENLGIPSFIVRLAFIFTLPFSFVVYFFLAYFVFDDGYI
ncbi:PspC domain-containing protein [Salinicoccus sp. ID82-1]|uniref:PspC domain-containing protein n=1 Tax=Salinicoccus sp. ID82-1 TaxID=2820269 RepID=UPI001F15C815|nr:PspC domain-containing protein [Salinicoccus sp. ID82-1]MCG1008947.1 PspC domain-containing protein [Salinicoccus sp. ID82-1]